MDKERLKELWEQFLTWLKKWLLEFILQNTFKKSAAAMSGVKGWVVFAAYNIGWKQIILPFINKMRLEALTAADKIKNKQKVKDVHDAESKEDFDSKFDSMP